MRGNLASGTQRASYMADRADTYADLVVTLLTIGRVDEAFRIADGARGRGLLEHLGAAARGLPSRGSAADLAEGERLLRRIDLLIERLRSSDSGRAPNPNRALTPLEGSLARDLTDARHEYEAVLGRLARTDPRSRILGSGGVDVDAVRRALAPDETLLEFLSSSERLV